MKWENYLFAFFLCFGFAVNYVKDTSSPGRSISSVNENSVIIEMAMSAGH